MVYKNERFVSTKHSKSKFDAFKHILKNEVLSLVLLAHFCLGMSNQAMKVTGPSKDLLRVTLGFQEVPRTLATPTLPLLNPPNGDAKPQRSLRQEVSTVPSGCFWGMTGNIRTIKILFGPIPWNPRPLKISGDPPRTSSGFQDSFVSIFIDFGSRKAFQNPSKIYQKSTQKSMLCSTSF